MTQKKQIPVSFVIYEPYETWPMYEKHVGHIPVDMVNKFLQIIANSPRITTNCVDYMSACYENIVSVIRGENAFTPRDERKKCDIFSGRIMLSGFFDTDYTQEGDDEPRRCPMCVQHKNRKRSEQNKMHACATAIKSGKCVDPMMRKLAAMMYPDKYKETQR